MDFGIFKMDFGIFNSVQSALEATQNSCWGGERRLKKGNLSFLLLIIQPVNAGKK